MAMADVTIRGAGIFGLSIAWACARRGAKVVVVDPNGPAAGASGGIVGALAPHVPENWNPKKQFQLESLLMAANFWAEVEATGGHPSGYIRAGRVQPVVDLDLAMARQQGASELWHGQADWLIEDAPEWSPKTPLGKVIRDTLSAHLHPRQASLSLQSALSVKGVRIETTARDMTPTIWATGVAGLGELNSGRARMVGMGIKGQAALLDFDASGLPQLFADGLHIIPHLDGTTAIGSTTEREYDDPTGTDAQLNTLVDKARRLVPALAEAPVIATWAGLRPRARSRAPMLGPWPDRQGHFIANGGFKIGFGMAPKVAETMADLVLEGRNTIPDGFRVEDSF